MATALQLTKEWQTLCDLQGIDPAVLLNYNCLIKTFGGAANHGKVASWVDGPSAGTTMQGVSIPWDCMVVGATVKYANGGVAGGCVVAGATSALRITCTSAAGTLIAAAATITGGSTSTLIDLANAEIASKHFQKSSTGLSIALNAGTQLFVSSLVLTAGVDATGPVASDLSITLQLAVPQSKFVLPTVS